MKTDRYNIAATKLGIGNVEIVDLRPHPVVVAAFPEALRRNDSLPVFDEEDPDIYVRAGDDVVLRGHSRLMSLAAGEEEAPVVFVAPFSSAAAEHEFVRRGLGAIEEAARGREGPSAQRLVVSRRRDDRPLQLGAARPLGRLLGLHLRDSGRRPAGAHRL